LQAIYDPDIDTALYSFVPAGHTGTAEMSMSRDFARRESVQSIPSMDGVLDGYGRVPGPMDRREVAFSFRVLLDDGDLDRAYDLLMAAIGPGTPVRLVYQTDQGALWYTTASNPAVQHTVTSGNNWGHGGYCDFQVTWRIRPDWRPRYSEAAEVFHVNTLFVAGTRFGSAGSTVILAQTQSFTIDATGIAGSNLPTIPDYGVTITVNGPLGGSVDVNGQLGFRVVNGTLTVRDSTGAQQQSYFDVPIQLVDAFNGVTLKMDRQSFTFNGIPFRPRKPAYQPWYFGVKPGVVNSCAVVGLGQGTHLGYSVTAVTITNGGSGYASPPAVSFTGGGGGAAAAGRAILDGAGHVIAVQLTAGGFNYLSPPTVGFTGGGGSGAAATAGMTAATIKIDWNRKRA
jgi:hypothetical protein